ncbi:MAG: precorrin-3B C(17)-methyltransferase, partial [Duncaniella sp.]|nr:precorrin-3B C(17)-methyltransferase [Duncaniella sp.]
MKAKISVIGLGPGGLDDMTSKAKAVISNSKIIVGYNYYIPFIESLIGADTEILQNGMRQEQDRIMKAFEIAESGKDVTVISSGDAGIYGMAPLVYETLKERGADIEVEVVPGISAFQKAASLLGAPIGHDFCVISLSDLMTPWDIIEKRIKAAGEADFVTAVYNPKSHGRYW